jgi:hypothetical protein
MAESSSSALSSQVIVRLLADRDRRLVVAGLLLGATEPGDIAGQVGLGHREVLAALDRLVAGGLVERLDDAQAHGGRFHLLEEAFQVAARSEAPPPAPSEHPDEPQGRRVILDRALRDGRLLRMPTKYTHRQVVLDHLAQLFEPGRRYTERQVNAVLAAVDADVATLRRYLVDDGLLDRGDGEYWRSGGTVHLD